MNKSLPLICLVVVFSCSATAEQCVIKNETCVERTKQAAATKFGGTGCSDELKADCPCECACPDMYVNCAGGIVAMGFDEFCLWTNKDTGKRERLRVCCATCALVADKIQDPNGICTPDECAYQLTATG